MAWGVGAVLGSLPVRAAAPCSTWKGQGQGSPSLPRRVKGAQRGGAACRTQQSSSELAEKSKWEPYALQRSYLGPVQHGTGEGLGQRLWESILGGTHWFCSTKAGGSIRAPKAAVLGGAGEEQYTWWGDRTLVFQLLAAGQTEMHHQPVLLCHESCGCQGGGSAQAPWVGSQWFGVPVLLGS